MPCGLRLDQQYHATLDREVDLAFRIDLVLRTAADGRVLAVLDTKYKHSAEPDEADISQVTAYAVRMKTKEAFLIFPSTATKLKELFLDDIRVRSIVFDLARSVEEAGLRCLSYILSNIRDL